MDGILQFSFILQKYGSEFKKKVQQTSFSPAPTDTNNVAGQEDMLEELLAALIEWACHYGITVEMEDFLSMGVAMDDNNEPVPESVPTNNNNSEVVYNAWSGQQNYCAQEKGQAQPFSTRCSSNKSSTIWTSVANRVCQGCCASKDV